MLYLLYGPDRFRAREELRAIRGELDRDGNLAHNTTRLEGGTTPAELRAACHAASFFAESRLVCNAEMAPAEVRQYCQAVLDEQAQSLLRLAMNQLSLSARAFHRVLKLARTIADMAGSERIESPHLAEAVQYRQRLRA